MILRKPYAFLIKHFKLIHLIISLLLLFLISKTMGVLKFFKDYIALDIFKVVSSEYINFFVYLAIILVLALVITMIVLMRKKEKPLFFYIITIVAYSAIFIGFIYVNSIINTLEMHVLDRKTINLGRDVTNFMLIAQWIFLIPYVFRTLGFDIKKFDFKKDLKELDIDVSDNEEFELTTGIDYDKLKKKGRRRLRELKYYYLENKLFILIIFAVVLVIVGYNVITSIEITKKYDENEVIQLDNYYTLNITDSYITTKDNNGKEIKTNDTFFLIVKFNINSTYQKKFQLDTNKFILNIKDNEFIPTKQYYQYFTNYGIGYKNQKIYLNDSKDFILVYSVPNKYKNKKMQLEYNYRFDYSGGEEKMIKKIVKLSPEIK